MAAVKNPEVGGAPATVQKEEGRKHQKKKTASPIIRIRNMSSTDLPISGDVIKSGETRSYPAHIGKALLQTQAVDNYIRLKKMKVI